MSLVPTAVCVSLPSPVREKIVSTITAPARMLPKVIPAMVRAGRLAFRKTSRLMTHERVPPLASDVVT